MLSIYWHSTYFSSYLKEKKILSSFFKRRNVEKLVSYVCLDKLIYFLNHKISLPVENPSLYLLNLQFLYFGLLSWYTTVQNQLFSGFKCLKIVGAFGALLLDPTRGITPPSPIQSPMDPAMLGMPIGCWLSNNLFTLFFPNFLFVFSPP